MADGLSLSVSGLEAVVSGLENVAVKYQNGAARAIKNAAKTCYDDSQTNCPVSSDYATHMRVLGGKVSYAHVPGSLKGSGQMTQLGETAWEVSYGGDSSTGEHVDYQWYVELGTCKMAAQPYLYPAFEYASRLLEIDMMEINTLSSIG